MHVHLKQPSELSSEELTVWRNLIAADAQFSSPYFNPQFTLDVATVRNDVEVAVIKSDGQTAGFFPFQRAGRTAKPVGGQLSDAHGFVHDGSIDWTWPELLQKCELAAFDFHYLIGSQTPDTKWQAESSPAAVMNLAGGFDEYAKRLESKSCVKQTDRKGRKLGRERGELRFEWNCTDASVFDTLTKWKSQQYQNSGIADVFSFDWTIALLKQIQSHQASDYEGLMSVLYVGDSPAAIHFGLRSGNVLHQWFPAYDPQLQQHSPGIIHLLEMARHAENNGVERIDLGRICHYKSRVATHCVDVSEGSVDLRPVTRMLRNGYQQTFEWLRHSPLRTVARIPGRMLRKLAERKQFQ